MPKTSVALAISITVHLAIGGMILLSVKFPSLAPPEQLQLSQPIIEARVIDGKVIEQQANKIKEQQQSKLRAEQKRREDLDRQKKRQLREKKRAEQAVVAARDKKKRQEDEAKRVKNAQAENDKKRKAEQQKAQRETEQRQKEQQEKDKAAERKRQEDREKAKQEQRLAEQLQTEQVARQQRRNKQVLSEVQKYQVLIRQTIQRNWITDDSMKGKSCVLNIRLASNGLVIQVKQLEGDTIVCRSAKAAVLKSDTLPVSAEPDVYEKLKDINLTVRPEL